MSYLWLQKVRIYTSVFYPHYGDRALSEHEKIDVLCKIPNIFKELENHLTYRQIEILKMMSYGCTHQEICSEVGYKNRSSITGVINDIRRIILEAMMDTRSDEQIEDDIIKLTEDKDGICSEDERANRGRTRRTRKTA